MLSTIKNIKHHAIQFLFLVVMSMLLYIAISWVVFAIRHPNAGDRTFFTNFYDVVTFGKLEDDYEGQRIN